MKKEIDISLYFPIKKGADKSDPKIVPIVETEENGAEFIKTKYLLLSLILLFV